MAAPSALTLAPWCHGGSPAPELTRKYAGDGQGLVCEALELVFCKVNLVMTLRVKDCTGVTGSPGLSQVFADKLDAKNNLPSSIGTHIWERMRKEGWGAGMPVCPGSGGSAGLLPPASSNKICSQDPPHPAQRRPGVCEHYRRPPRAARRALHPLPAFHTPLYSRSALRRAHSPRRSHGQGGILIPPCHSGGLSGCCPLAEGLAGPRRERGMLRGPQRAARTSPLYLGQFSPRCPSPRVGVGTGHRGMGRLAARVPPPATADTNPPRHTVSGRNPFYIPELRYK